MELMYFFCKTITNMRKPIFSLRTNTDACVSQLSVRYETIQVFYLSNTADNRLYRSWKGIILGIVTSKTALEVVL